MAMRADMIVNGKPDGHNTLHMNAAPGKKYKPFKTDPNSPADRKAVQKKFAKEGEMWKKWARRELGPLGTGIASNKQQEKQYRAWKKKKKEFMGGILSKGPYSPTPEEKKALEKEKAKKESIKVINGQKYKAIKESKEPTKPNIHPFKETYKKIGGK